MFSQDFARFRAVCPSCQQEASILFESRQLDRMYRKVESSKCLSCGGQGPSFEYKDIQALVEQTQLGARLEMPWDRAVADARTIRQVLNTALIVRYKLRVCLATEGGVQGVVRNRYIELRNDENQIGLMSDSVGAQSFAVTGSVLAFYARMLADLFVRELRFKGRTLGFGAALTAQPQQLVPLLHVVLSNAVPGKSEFANRVLREWARFQEHDIARRFIAGLTDEDIAELFVEPPM